MNILFCICKLAITFYMMNKIQPQRKSKSIVQCPFMGIVNPEIVKNIAHSNFLIITVKYIKVYISGMEMSQRIHF